MDQNLTKNQSPAVSVIMAAYNVEKYIDEAVESVLTQTLTDLELIIVDNASTDQTLNKIKYWAERDKRIKYHRNQVNGTPASARNAAIKIATGRYLAVLDSDDVAMPQRLKKQLDFMEKNRDVAALGTGAIVINEKGDVLGTKVKSTNFSDIKFAMLLQYQFMNSSMIFRRSAFEAVGGYPKSAAEDYALLSLLIEKGYRVTNLTEALIKFRAHSQSWTMSPQTTGRHAEAALSVTLSNIRPYLTANETDVMNLVNMMNAKNITLPQTLRALLLYRKLTKSYLAKTQLSSEEKSSIQKIYRNKVKAVLISRLKKIFDK